MLLQRDTEDLLQTEISLNLPILTPHKVDQQTLLVPENKTKIVKITVQFQLLHLQVSSLSSTLVLIGDLNYFWGPG
jgi:hypothetical protein